MLDQLHSMTMVRKTKEAAVLLLLLSVGCSPSKHVAEKSQEPAKEKKLSLAQYEATLNPADYDQEIEVVQKAYAEEKSHGPLNIPKDSTVVQEEMVQGFRIQVFSSSNVDDANNAKNTAAGRFPNDSVYVIYDPPVYKVRVGDFVNRYDANQRLPEFVDKGYRDAWIVPDQVEQRKLVRVPLPK
jgi:hypothetical protein